MNPISLKLKNFRNYKDEVITFSHDGVMPIVGKNGHGKSSIFYGILLALYGKVIIDGTETTIRELITDDDSKNMEVEYKFSHDGSIYVISRVYHLSISKKDVTKCEQVKCELIQIIDNQEILLTAKTKSNTDSKIIDILGKDCDNFCNSAFFPQDEANRLARLKPAEFIEEVSKLKKITIWELLREKAVYKLDKIKMMIGGIDSYLEICKEEITKKPQIESAIANLNKNIVISKEEIKKVEKEVTEIKNERIQLSDTFDNIKKIENDIKLIKDEINDFNLDISTLGNKINEENEIIARKINIENDFQELQKIEQSKKILDEALMNRNNLMNQISILEKDVNNARQNIERTYQQMIINHDNALSSLNNADTIQNRYEQCRQVIESFSQLEIQINEINNINNGILVEITTLKANNDHLSKQINEETEKMHKFMHDRICFECERPVDDVGMNFIKVKKTQKIDNLKAIGRDNFNKITLLEQQIDSNKIQLSSMNEKKSEISKMNRELGQLETQLNNINTARQTIENLAPEINRLRGIIEKGLYSDKLELLNSIKQQMGVISYSPDEHQYVNSRYNDLKTVFILKQDLDRAEKELPSLIDRKNILTDKIIIKQNKLSELLGSLESFDRTNIESKLDIARSREEEAINALSTKQDNFNQLMKEFGAQQQIMQSIIDKEKELIEKMEEVKDLKEEQYLLDRAIEMYSKSGIPTLIIENMLPEIENQANELLKIMQADRMVSFERPKRVDGSYQDKIVIMVRDRRGQKRTFNTFSGAECFQISFALRVAICGGEEVMFIDEGFGKLDQDNLTLIMKTLSAMKTKFNKIILITHVQDLIEMFDIKLNVKLDAKGYSTTEWTKN